MELAIKERSDRRVAVELELTGVSGHVVIGSATWLDDHGRRRERYHVLTLRDGKIVDLQGCKTRRQAERFARNR